tara:strand:- start:37 stop:543 length:507 start_codon:yes stop_codon:yes gene_type:complete
MVLNFKDFEMSSNSRIIPFMTPSQQTSTTTQRSAPKSFTIHNRNNDSIIKVDNINNKYRETPFEQLIYATSYTDNDGYDKYGPQAHIYHIIIAFKNGLNDNIMVDTWRAEYRYREKKVQFDCYSTEYSQKDFDVFKKEELENQDDSFKSIRDDLVLEGSSYMVDFDIT